MSDSSAFAFGKIIPGFDFLQRLANTPGQNPASALPGLGGWVAPTVSEQELDKRIQELKAVLFWLEQNTTAVKATIQALQVQKMTLATLAGMNLSMAEVAKAFTAAPATAPSPGPASDTAPSAASQWPFHSPGSEAPPPQAATAPSSASAPSPAPAPTPDPASAHSSAPVPASSSEAPPPEAASPAPSLADPLQWWGALTQQFQHIAASALQEAARTAMPAPSSPAPRARRSAQTATAGKTRAKPKPKAAKPARTAKSTTKTAAKTATKRQARTPAKTAAQAKPAPAGWPLPPSARPAK